MARGKGRLPTGMTLRKDGLIEYRFIVDGKRYSVYGTSATDCKKKEIDKRERIQQQMAARNANVTLSKYYDEWIAARKGTVTAATIYCDNRRFKHIRKVLGSRKVAKIERREIIALQKSLSETLSTASVNDIMSLLRSILRSAVIDRITQWNPADGIKRLQRTETPASETIHRALTADEQTTFFKYAADSWYYNFMRFLLLTGMRTGEAAALTWADIDRKAEVIHITKSLSRTGDNSFEIGKPKTRTSRRDIPLTADMIATLDSQKEMQKAVNGYKVVAIDQRIFTATDGKGYIVATTMCNIIKNILGKAAADGHEIERFSAHCFRDTFATEAIRQGMEPQTLKTILGHSSLAMTMDLYSHVMPDTKKQQMDKIKIIV